MRVAIVYEQWGWPLTTQAWAELCDRFKGDLLVLDRVDSANFLVNSESHGLPPGTVEVVSLSKLLGIAGGGLARANGCLIPFAPEPESDSMRRLRRRPPAALARAGYQEVFKESRQAVHPTALAWLERNCLHMAVEAERAARQTHLAMLVDSALSVGWPAWMVDAVGDEAGAVWAPLLRWADAARRWSATRTLQECYGVVSATRLFNWSGNPLRPEYEMCLAVPAHGGVAAFAEMIAALQ